MQILIASEFKCTIYNNEFYLAPKAYQIYNRYAEVFGDVCLCSRTNIVDYIPRGYKKADFIKKLISINSLEKVLLGQYDSKITVVLKNVDFVILRTPSAIAYRIAFLCSKLNIQYLDEMMGDAWDSYWNHSFLGKLVAPYMEYRMRQVAFEASYAIYVTSNYLQVKYPCKCPNINASNVYISETVDSILEMRLDKIKKMDKKNIVLMTTAAVDARAKGHRYVFEAMKKLKVMGINTTYNVVGGGNNSRLKKLAQKYGVSKFVRFIGELPIGDVYKKIDESDIYVQPSLQEGLPRAVIEAMSRGCICLGSKTAGTPELLPKECIFMRKSADAIVEKILFILGQDMSRYAQINYDNSKLYLDHVIGQRRTSFLYTIRENISNVM